MTTSAFSPVAIAIPSRLAQMNAYRAAASLHALGLPSTRRVKTCQVTRTTSSANRVTHTTLSAWSTAPLTRVTSATPRPR